MATYVERALATIDALRGSSTDPAVAQTIVNRFCEFIGIDTMNSVFGTTNTLLSEFTNSQKARIFVEGMKRLARRVAREAAKKEVTSTYDADVDAAVAAEDAKFE